MLVINLIRFYIHMSRRFLAVFLVSFLLNPMMLDATPQYNIYDPAVVHTVYGADKFYQDREKSAFALHISPFYQHTSTASQQLGENLQNGFTNKVPLGNRLGRWNMVALYYNPAGPIPSSLVAARTQIIGAEGSLPSITDSSGINFNLSGSSNANVPASVQAADESMAGTIATTAVNYERLGLRGQMSFDFSFGLGMTAKGGLIDYKQAPTFTASSSAPTSAAGQMVLSQLNTQGQREAIADQFGLNLSEQRLTTLEDTHIDLHWSLPFKRYDQGDYVYTLVPFFSIGAWIPTGTETDQDKAFSLPTGNDGFPGGTVEFSINFDFPKMFQIGFGGGAAFFGTRTLNNQRVPTSELQVGIIPWKTTISKKPGPVWYFNASMKADQFDIGFSFFLDYVFTQHIKDTIVLLETNQIRLGQFQQGLDSMVSNSSWKSQHLNAGIKYDITSNCSLGLSVQGYISGIRTCRVTTVLIDFAITL